MIKKNMIYMGLRSVLLTGVFALLQVLCADAQVIVIKEFNIEVGLKGNTLVLNCEDGCAWKELTFDLEDGGAPGYIDERGMATSEDDGRSSVDLADFHFSFLRKGGEILCVSTKGTAWEDLSFSCESWSCNALIDESGVSVK